MSASPSPVPLQARFRAWIGTRPPFGRRLHEALFARGLPRLVMRRLQRSDDPAAAPLARAVAAIAGRGIEPAEADWIERIETVRSEFAASPPESSAGLRPVGHARDLPPDRIARVSSIHRPWGTFLLRLVRELHPRSCLELGTSIGISAAYQGAGLALNGDGTLRSIEGSPGLASRARELLGGLGLETVEVIDGRLEDVLHDVLQAAAPIDLAFLDAGKGREHALLQFRRLLPHMAPRATVVMDDVHWSREMSAAWREIRAHPRVGLSVDLWRLGACLLRPA